MRISTWYQSKGDQSGEQYTKKGEVRSLKFLIAGTESILITSQNSLMVFNGLRFEYALDGSSNYITWKDRMEAVLEDNGLKDCIDQEVPKPVVANVQELA